MIKGFTSVVGDLFHPGHMAMINECRKHCDHLTVGLICDPTDRKSKHAPVESVFERWYRLKNCVGIDEIIPLQGEQDLELALRILDINVRFVGQDYKLVDHTGRATCEARGIPIIYTVRNHNLSSTNLRARVAEAEKVQEG